MKRIGGDVSGGRTLTRRCVVLFTGVSGGAWSSRVGILMAGTRGFADRRLLNLPRVAWRKGLKLSGKTAVEKITLDGVQGLRVMLIATVHDVLYYMSPIYCQDIINSVSNQLNRLYLKFRKRISGYDGKVCG
ncbi:hypothetical protein Patl1_10761 [Pistacia atlantica]|uniref:Uncharacterized protein n=1 Tax=Pistacia atlantica TaxID=434234 RepID=A0ACC0ZZM8_9ROSI|nr:hypothetical protein Patl1_10761 [Pistacia atlantica]